MEQALIHFPGAVIVVSHDRYFLDKIATQLLVFDADGSSRLFNGNWTMLQSQTPVP
jgi:ATP-binding cassette subfamily F protein 3